MVSRVTSAMTRPIWITPAHILLWTVAAHPGRVLSRDFLPGQTRRRDAAPFDRTIDVQVGRLRRKMEVDADDPQLIKSVRSAKYILVSTVEHG